MVLTESKVQSNLTLNLNLRAAARTADDKINIYIFKPNTQFPDEPLKRGF